MVSCGRNKQPHEDRAGCHAVKSVQVDTGIQVWSMYHLSSFHKHLFYLILLSQHPFEAGHNISDL